MAIRAVHSTQPSAAAACAELSGSLEGEDPRAVIFFASPAYDPQVVSSELAAHFPHATLFGCTTAGEIVSGEMLEHSIVAMSLPSDIVKDVSVQVLERVSSENPVPGAFEAFSSHFGKPMADLDIEKYVGIILVDGLSGAEEKLMETLGDLSDITFIGASAGDDLKFDKTHVFADGKAYSDAALFVVLELERGFDIIKTQSFVDSGKKLVATAVDEPSRTVLRFDDAPAAESYARALGVDVESAPDHFMRAPVGLMVGDEPYVRSPQQIREDDGGMVFYCHIKEGMELSILESTDIPKDTRQAVEAKKRELGEIAGLINFHCILRTLELKKKEQMASYGAIFSEIPTIGFSTYGEEYIGHVNQTSTMLVFK